MAGIDYVNRYPKSRAKKGKTILELKNIYNDKNTIKAASLYLRSGEIIGIAGMQGAGKTSLSRLIAGVDRIASGQILVNQSPMVFKNPYDASKSGIAYLNESNEVNLCMMMNTSYNITLANLKSLTKKLFCESPYRF